MSKYTDSELFNLIGDNTESTYDIWKTVYPDAGNEAEFLDFIRDTNSLSKNNTAEYIPTGDYNPATKKYVDDITNKIYEEVLISLADLNLINTFVDNNHEILTSANGDIYIL